MTQRVYQGEHYSVVGTVNENGVSFAVQKRERHYINDDAYARFRNGDCYLQGYREPNSAPWFLRWLYGRQLSIQEAAARAVDRCRLADEQFRTVLAQRRESSAELMATAEVQKIVAEL